MLLSSAFLVALSALLSVAYARSPPKCYTTVFKKSPRTGVLLQLYEFTDTEKYALKTALVGYGMDKKNWHKEGTVVVTLIGWLSTSDFSSIDTQSKYIERALFDSIGSDYTIDSEHSTDSKDSTEGSDYTTDSEDTIYSEDNTDSEDSAEGSEKYEIRCSKVDYETWQKKKVELLNETNGKPQPSQVG